MQGAQAEARAAEHLRSLGRLILCQNYRMRGGEIDIVSRDQNGQLIFSEVRHRSKANHGSALESVTPRKLALMQRAAQSYLLRELGHEEVACQLEVICIDGEVMTGQMRVVTLD